ncbi:MAG: cell division protein ZapA [Thermodesulfobacteriota bacterium]|jgi:cell division protein ZapA
MKALIEVEIFGQRFTVTSEDEEDYVKKIATHVDQKMRHIAETTKTAVPLRVAIMAAMSIADEYYKAAEREAEIQREADRLSAVLLERLEESEKRDGVQNRANSMNTFTASSSQADGTKKDSLSSF